MDMKVTPRKKYFFSFSLFFMNAETKEMYILEKTHIWSFYIKLNSLSSSARLPLDKNRRADLDLSTFWVKEGATISETSTVVGGIPQGTILYPILYICLSVMCLKNYSTPRFNSTPMIESYTGILLPLSNVKL